jgi:hypothetical protein
MSHAAGKDLRAPLAPGSDRFPPFRRSSTPASSMRFSTRKTSVPTDSFRLMFERLDQQLKISPADLEMTIFETPKHNWGFRGLPGDEHNPQLQS